MISKSIIGVLLAGLAVIVALFLYSDHQLQDENSAAATTTTNTTTSTISNNGAAPIRSANTESTTRLVTQPDKSLPMPAHQLKKLIADKPSTSALDQKIQKANQAIAVLNKALLTQSETTVASSPTDKTTDEKSEAIKKRLQNLKDHLNKQE